jgi:hypothetical protein
MTNAQVVAMTTQLVSIQVYGFFCFCFDPISLHSKIQSLTQSRHLCTSCDAITESFQAIGIDSKRNHKINKQGSCSTRQKKMFQNCLLHLSHRQQSLVPLCSGKLQHGHERNMHVIRSPSKAPDSVHQSYSLSMCHCRFRLSAITHCLAED